MTVPEALEPGVTSMTPRDRVLCTLRGGQADRVPYDLTHCSNGLGGFNREAARLFRERTGSDNPDEYFGVERDVAWVHLQDTATGPDRAIRFLPSTSRASDLLPPRTGPNRSDVFLARVGCGFGARLKHRL